MDNSNRGNNFIDILYIKVKTQPESPLFLSLAEELRKNDRIDEAIDVLTEGLRHNPNFTAARLKLALWYRETGMLEEAARETEKALKADKDNISARRLALQISKDSGNTEAALTHARAILSLMPCDREAKIFLQGQGGPFDIDSATVEDKTVQKTPLPEASGDREELQRDIRQTVILTEQGRFREALMMCDMVLANHPKERGVLQMREELNSLLRLLRRKKDAIIDRLKRFEQLFTGRAFRVH